MRLVDALFTRVRILWHGCAIKSRDLSFSRHDSIGRLYIYLWFGMRKADLLSTSSYSITNWPSADFTGRTNLPSFRLVKPWHFRHSKIRFSGRFNFVHSRNPPSIGWMWCISNGSFSCFAPQFPHWLAYRLQHHLFALGQLKYLRYEKLCELQQYLPRFSAAPHQKQFPTSSSPVRL